MAFANFKKKYDGCFFSWLEMPNNNLIPVPSGGDDQSFDYGRSFFFFLDRIEYYLPHNSINISCVF